MSTQNPRMGSCYMQLIKDQKIKSLRIFKDLMSLKTHVGILMRQREAKQTHRAGGHMQPEAENIK